MKFGIIVRLILAASVGLLSLMSKAAANRSAADLSLGYNSLHRGPPLREDEAAGDAHFGRDSRDFPDGKRLWSWLIIGDDG